MVGKTVVGTSAIQHPDIVLIAKPGGEHTGVGRYTQMLYMYMQEAGVDVVRVAPTLPSLPARIYRWLKWGGVDLRAFLLNYPVWASYPAAPVFHLTSQNLASLLLFRRPPGRVIVTVHDIIPFILRHDAIIKPYRTVMDRWFDRLAMVGLRRADVLVADSIYTKQSLVTELGISPSKIKMVYLGIDHKQFCPAAVEPDFRERYSLAADRRYLIYVGSEDPRKNLVTLLQAFAKLRAELPDVELLKVGRAHFEHEREQLKTVARQLGVLEAVHFLDDVPESDLRFLYNVADVCVMPSLYEGFGFPVLEAMACGTAVVCAAATSLIEIGATASIQVPPHDVQELVTALLTVLGDSASRVELQQRGRAHAARFTWDRTTTETVQAYGNPPLGVSFARDKDR
ncbi:MAG: hypothetical protein NVSMB42_00530 [Herpetosiphon sp.]